ncbi:TPA: RNA-binding protein [Candidatus Delongbacteria bacterium]|nr:MAG: hypothetical protein A2Y39_05095 [Candidatus Delongbacteria bacterium GWF2_40_14]HAQ60975.1 RNA-binding protein [Candidatus Delongbacteria bacterium]
MKIYAGNLSYTTKDDDLKKAFEEFGQVDSAVVVTDKIDGRSKGFGFVEMPNNDEALNAIKEMNGRELNGRELKVNESKPKPEGEGNRGFHGGSRGGFGGGNRGGQTGNRGGFNNSRGGSRGDR